MTVGGGRCLVCGGTSHEMLVAVSDVPTLCNRLCGSETEAINTPRGDIELIYCRDCGHVSNSSFDPARVDYDWRFDNTLSFSPRYLQYAQFAADRLTRRYRLNGKRIVEIGCGRGDFLRLLAGAGNRGFGYDPSQPEGRTLVQQGSVEIFGRKFTPEDANGADFICCRHVLEHLPEPMELLCQLREAIGDRHDVVVFFEVPNGLFTLERLGIWDIIYEHVSYFTPSSLVAAFHHAGFTVRDAKSSFDEQYLWIEAVADGGKDGASDTLSPKRPQDGLYTRFGSRFDEKLNYWADRITKFRSEGRRVAVWGAGAKGVMFLNLLHVTPDSGVDRVVDINPRKQGHFMPATGQRIVAPDWLVDAPADPIIVMNPQYKPEIQVMVKKLGINCELVDS